MKVILAEHCGFCYGVKRAVELACVCGQSAAAGQAQTLGPIIHNPQMVERLARQGVGVAGSLEDIPAGGTVIFRSLGVGPSTYEAAEEKGLAIVDATCPHVRKAQQAARQLAGEGYQVVVIGERQHPEVKSIVAWSGKQTIVVESVQEAQELAFFARIGVVVQTTFAGALFQSIVAVLRTKCDEIKVNRTICNATELRQKAAMELAGKVEVMLVVGGKNSSNTTKLARLAEESGCRTYHVETAQELRQHWFNNIDVVGVTAGASTPDWLIEEVMEKMQEFDQEMQETVTKIEKGSIVTGKVIAVHKDEVFVDIGYKAEGIIPLAELAYPVPERAEAAVAVGDVLEVFVVSEETADGNVVLSKVKADHIVAWDKVLAALENKQVLMAKAVEAVKGGLVVSVLGIRGFVPASQLDLKFVEDITVFVGQELELVPIEVDRDKNRIVLSRRAVLQKEREEKEKAVYGSIQAGQVLTGTVSRLAAFGAFVDIGGIDGLIHISDLSWQRVKSPEEVVAVGDQVEVSVLKVDSAAKRISLGLKQIQKDPWFDAAAELPEGAIVKGKVSKIAKFGVFVALRAGLEGLVHISELSDHHITKPEEVVTLGQEVAVKVLGIDTKQKKISLSLSKAQEEKERAEYQDYLSNHSSMGVTIGEKLGHLFKRED